MNKRPRVTLHCEVDQLLSSLIGAEPPQRLTMERLDADLQTHGGEITKLLRRSLAQADSLGLMGTPSYIVGEYRVTQALNYEGFKRVAVDARACATQN